MKLTFGVIDHIDKNSQPINELYEDRLKLIELYDKAGFYAFHVTEHHATPLGMAPSPGIFLSAAIQRTTKLRFAPLIYILPLYDPIRLASEICMLDQLSNGRYEIGVGRGISPYEMAYFNINPLETREIFHEVFEVMINALTHDAVIHKGERFSYRGTPMELSPFQKPHPPLWYGPGSPESIAWCAARSMHIVSNFDNKGAAEQIRRFSEDHARLNPDKPMPRLGITRFFHVAETDAEAEARGRQAYRSWYESYATLWRKFDHRPALTDDEAADRRAQGTAIYGTPETVRAAIERDIEATGADYFATRFAYGDLTRDESTRSLELFTSEVLPHFEIDNTPR